MNEKISYSAYQIANNFDAYRKGLPDEFQDWAAEISRYLRQLAAAQVAPAGMVLVPREPTAAMLKVAAHEGGGCTLGQADGEYYPSFDDPMTRRVWAAMLAAAPAAQVADDESREEAFSDFESDYLTDGNGYAPASTYEACSAAFNAAWPDRKAAHAAALAEFARIHGHTKTTGQTYAEFVRRQDDSDRAAEAAAPAVVVDEAMVERACRAVKYWCNSWDDLKEIGRASFKAEMRKALAAALTQEGGR